MQISKTYAKFISMLIFLQQNVIFQKQYIFLHKMVQEIINHNYDVKDDDGEILYQNVAICHKPQPAVGHIYENAAAIQ